MFKQGLFAIALSLLCSLTTLAHCDVFKSRPEPYDNSLAANDLTGEFYGSLYFLSNYITDGLSATRNTGAVQGDLAYRVPIGFYAGLWISNTRIGDFIAATIEYDPYVGWAGEYHHFLWDVYLTYIIYPNTGDFDINYWEVRGKFGFERSCFSANFGLAYADNYNNIAGTFISPFLEAEVRFPHEVAGYLIVSHVSLANNDKFGIPDYNYWHVGVKKTIFSWLESGAEYYGTTIPKSQCFVMEGRGESICGKGGLIYIGHEF